MSLLGFAALLASAAGAFDRGADGEFESRSSAHFNLYQDVAIDRAGGIYGTRHFEQQVLAELERAYDALDAYLGLRAARRIDVVIYDPGAFDREFAGAFRFSAAGFYHGVIRVRGATALDVPLARVLHHELVHAALDASAPSYSPPAWLNEGLAEWFEARTQGKRRLSQGELAFLTGARASGAWFSLASLSTPSFGHLNPNAARLAYLQSYGMVEFLAQQRGERSLREFCERLLRTHNLERALQQVYRSDLRVLEARFAAELG
ncbi:MAG TPA: hypothetical protein VEC18_09525 [Myxococcota bacterium]|nr:hypothetical protein [Myxococcota bacterium]